MRFSILAAAGAAATIVSAGSARGGQVESLKAASQIQTPPTSPVIAPATVTPHTSLLEKDHYMYNSWTPTQKDAPPLPTQTCLMMDAPKWACGFFHHAIDFRIYGKNYDPRFIANRGEGLIETTDTACAGCMRRFRNLEHNKTANPDDWQFVYAYRVCHRRQWDVNCAGSVILQNGGRNAHPTHPDHPWWDMCTRVDDWPEEQPEPAEHVAVYGDCG